MELGKRRKGPNGLYMEEGVLRNYWVFTGGKSNASA